jgi:hypothetical protein
MSVIEAVIAQRVSVIDDRFNLLEIKKLIIPLTRKKRYGGRVHDDLNKHINNGKESQSHSAYEIYNLGVL